MKASIEDFRYRMDEILKAMDCNEEVTILYHDKVKGVIKPIIHEGRRRISDHPFFGMSPSKKTVDEVMADLRGNKASSLI